MKARNARGEYFHARGGAYFKKVCETLKNRLAFEKRQIHQGPRSRLHLAMVMAGPGCAAVDTLIWNNWYSRLNALRFH